eukprot:12947460-Alexandrium_andersonii.AAC.1
MYAEGSSAPPDLPREAPPARPLARFVATSGLSNPSRRLEFKSQKRRPASTLLLCALPCCE